MIGHEITVVCDSCGKRKKMKYAEDVQGKPIYNLPPGWGYGRNGIYTYCPKCFAGFLETNNNEKTNMDR